jgi:hypothetical protein
MISIGGLSQRSLYSSTFDEIERLFNHGSGPHGWFGDKASSSRHPGNAGLLWAINGGRLVELRRDWAVVDLAESQRIVDRRRLDVGNFRPPWNPWIGA